MSGAAATCALKLPVAPLILPSISTAASLARARFRRWATFAISLPSVVGVAGWPWVRASIASGESAMRAEDIGERRFYHCYTRPPPHFPHAHHETRRHQDLPVRAQDPRDPRREEPRTRVRRGECLDGGHQGAHLQPAQQGARP